jgi:small basic protein
MDEDSRDVPSVLEMRGDLLTVIWFAIGLFCALFGLLCVLFKLIQAPIPEHEQLHPFFLAVFTFLCAGAILGFVRAVLGGGAVLIVFIVILVFSTILASELTVWGVATMPSVLKIFNKGDWELLAAFSLTTLIGHRRFIPPE